VIRGEVDANDQAIIPLEVERPDGRREEIDFVIDTGFTGYLTLPSARIATLQLAFQQRQTYTLADGSSSVFDIFLATVCWDGQDRDVPVLATEGDPLVGMRILRGSRLRIEVLDGGEVQIEPLP
jgi:clan AA aspartic protease